MPDTFTPEEWAVCADPKAMLRCLFPPGSHGSHKDVCRRERLLACALARRDWCHLTAVARTVVVAAERFADGDVTAPFPFAGLRRVLDRFAACDGAAPEIVAAAERLAALGFPQADDDPDPYREPKHWRSAHAPEFFAAAQSGPLLLNAEAGYLDAPVVRCLFPLPSFVRPAFAPRWRTAAAERVAAGMYAARTFRHMPELADALAEAGCDDARALDHCRDPYQPHARGCWVVDLVTGRE